MALIGNRSIASVERSRCVLRWIGGTVHEGSSTSSGIGTDRERDQK